MAYYYQAALNWLSSITTKVWHSTSQLDREGWIVVLVVAAGLGFLCMRGLSNRARF